MKKDEIPNIGTAIDRKLLGIFYEGTDQNNTKTITRIIFGVERMDIHVSVDKDHGLLIEKFEH